MILVFYYLSSDGIDLKDPPVFNTSNELNAAPVPVATQDNGLSAILTFIPVLCSIFV